jgi:hypothetical protein
LEICEGGGCLRAAGADLTGMRVGGLGGIPSNCRYCRGRFAKMMSKLDASLIEIVSIKYAITCACISIRLDAGIDMGTTSSTLALVRTKNQDILHVVPQ